MLGVILGLLAGVGVTAIGLAVAGTLTGLTVAALAYLLEGALSVRAIALGIVIGLIAFRSVKGRKMKSDARAKEEEKNEALAVRTDGLQDDDFRQEQSFRSGSV